jgi:hypothetical protein
MQRLTNPVYQLPYEDTDMSIGQATLSFSCTEPANFVQNPSYRTQKSVASFWPTFLCLVPFRGFSLLNCISTPHTLLVLKRKPTLRSWSTGRLVLRLLSLGNACAGGGSQAPIKPCRAHTTQQVARRKSQFRRRLPLFSSPIEPYPTLYFLMQVFL